MANDVIIITVMLVFFIGMGAVLPFVQEEFGVTQTSANTDALDDAVGAGAQQSATGVLDVLFSIVSMFFWTFGSVPLLIDLLFLLPLRLAFAFLVARNIWVGGGS